MNSTKKFKKITSSENIAEDCCCSSQYTCIIMCNSDGVSLNLPFLVELLLQPYFISSCHDLTAFSRVMQPRVILSSVLILPQSCGLSCKFFCHTSNHIKLKIKRITLNNILIATKFNPATIYHIQDEAVRVPLTLL